MKKLVIAALLLSGIQASAAFVKIAECQGLTEKGQVARAVIFVNNAADTQGFIAINVQGADFGSATTVDWKANAAGYPRFFNNDFDLDIVINDKTKSVDDVLVGTEYVSGLQCGYDPSFR